MKKLLLLRHAKSSWDDPDLDDHERPLSERGERDAITMARFLSDNDEGLDVIYSSTAIRALDYAQLISEFCDISLVPELSFYTFDEDELMAILRSMPDTLSRVAVVAHNPAVTQLVNRLTDAELDNVPTAAVMSIECDIDEWADLTEACCDKVYFQTPKMLG